MYAYIFTAVFIKISTFLKFFRPLKLMIKTKTICKSKMKNQIGIIYLCDQLNFV